MIFLRFYLIIVFLNIFLVTQLSERFWTIALPNYDSILLGLVLLFSRIGVGLISSIIFLCGLYHIAGEFLHYFLNRKLFLGTDWLLIKDLKNYLLMSYGPIRAIGIVIFGLILLLIYYWIILKALCFLRTYRMSQTDKRTLLIICFGLLILCHEIHHKIAPNKSFLARNITQGISSFDHASTLKEFSQDLQSQTQKSILLHQKDLQQKPDIYLFFIESYGLASLELNQNIRQKLDSMSKKFESNYDTFSTVLESPVFGGQSWMAYATTNCSIHIDNQVKFKALFRSSLQCLPEYLSSQGYKTVEIKPGTKFGLLKEEVLKYQFTHSIIAKDLRYQAKFHGWSGIPDEYAVVKFFEDIKPYLDLNAPTLKEFFLTSSHAPWGKNVPFYGLDKRIINDQGKRYDDVGVIEDDTVQGYINSIHYSLAVIESTIEKYIKAPSIIIILGDHPPSGQIPKLYDRNLVPLHILASKSLQSKFIDLERGFIPKQRQPMFAMRKIQRLILTELQN